MIRNEPPKTITVVACWFSAKLLIILVASLIVS